MEDAPVKKNSLDSRFDDDFLVREGLDLLAAFRAIESEVARKSIITLVAAIAQAETDVEERVRSERDQSHQA